MFVGTDIVEIERIAQAYEKNKRFAERVLSPKELDLFNSFNDERQMSFLAGRFSAKEAYVKALGTGIGKIRFTDISIVPAASGAPIFEYAPIVDSIGVSISHSHAYATATVVLNLTQEELDKQLKQFRETKEGSSNASK